YNMVGISYFKMADARILREEIEKAYEEEENAQLFWDEVVDRNLDKLELTVEPVLKGQLVEIDTVEELRRVNESV
ncbi:MAG: choline kinase, partial [Lachnospiraceae bacterium]|nr:choline kinase [Lachnospiraceae bacterium]